MSATQRRVGYSTRRAGLVSPLSGDAYAQVIKVDLRNLLAQVFELDEVGRMDAWSGVVDVGDIAASVLERYPDEMPPPRIWELDE